MYFLIKTKLASTIEILGLVHNLQSLRRKLILYPTGKQRNNIIVNQYYHKLVIKIEYSKQYYLDFRQYDGRRAGIPGLNY